ncbi:pyridoxamine 5'-phosphate oxidase family protein [Cupriavidus sp. SZY C1]|uniref:pyridoxamine 5'-phosphate oxidase family protein n=1 Tax=Cupriavidus sp. SZY C1 TaxID=3055037 RepID=UPI0028B63965|nr:pyridoxamine 5'-phosphate oxidase family protein [Cupriavidus sp. SZY C1]MDT6964010.1 pyridoxamine 5'-phosphate oxidase family protein [Cupriavidus sp. SZY C1]
MTPHPAAHAAIQPGTPWHTGERQLQASIGVETRLAEVGPRVVRDYMPDQHRDFFAMLPSIVIGTVAPDGRPWATVRAGQPGFLHSPDPRRLDVTLVRDADDPADAGMEDGNAIGLLGIQPATRRRNRMNGAVHRADAGHFHVAVGQSFGNCPQYIQKRAPIFIRDADTPAPVAPEVLDALDPRARTLIRHADSFFVATYVDLPDGQRQVDVSHRGGKPGFVRVDDDGGLTIPDFAGNTFFNTLGNIVANPVAGLVFVSYATGDLLQMTGRAEVLTDSPDIARFEGAQRLWRFVPEQVVRRDSALPLRWDIDPDGASPQALATGSWG